MSMKFHTQNTLTHNTGVDIGTRNNLQSITHWYHRPGFLRVILIWGFMDSKYPRASNTAKNEQLLQVFIVFASHPTLPPYLPQKINYNLNWNTIFVGCLFRTHRKPAGVPGLVSFQGTWSTKWGSPSSCNFKPMDPWKSKWHTLQGINISHVGKRKIIFKMPFWGDMLVPLEGIYIHENPHINPSTFHERYINIPQFIHESGFLGVFGETHGEKNTTAFMKGSVRLNGRHFNSSQFTKFAWNLARNSPMFQKIRRTTDQTASMLTWRISAFLGRFSINLVYICYIANWGNKSHWGNLKKRTAFTRD